MPTRQRHEWRSDDGVFCACMTVEVLEKIMHACHARATVETGGILIGRYGRTHSCAIVTDVSMPPPDSTHSSTCFQRGVHGLQQWLDQLWRSDGHYYLGEWHYHPAGSPYPSQIDIEQMRAIARDVDYQCPEPLLLVVGGHTARSLPITLFLCSSGDSWWELVSTQGWHGITGNR
jgi:integrative and conjugative element protein (TIGR02256 family)